MPIINRSVLTQTPIINLEGRDQETANLQMLEAPTADAGNVNGQVVLPNGTAVPNATVMLFGSNGLPVEHTNSNAAGRFSIPRVPVGSYSITASEPQYLTPIRIPITVLRNGTTDVTITMQPDPGADRSALFGIVRESVSGDPINDVTIEISRVTGTTLETIGIVSTNPDGQYMIADLPDGTYRVSAAKIGYLENQSADTEISGRTFTPMDIILANDPDANTGTISGLISNSVTNQPVNGAFVALYSIQNGNETIIDMTRSNAGGFYMFGDLVAGTYRIKASVQVQE